MPNKKQIELLERIKKIFLQGEIVRFSMKNSTRGFLIVDPRIKENSAFLDFIGEKSGKDATNQGLIIAAIGFGNLDHEFPEAKKAIEKYQDYLKEKGVNSETIINSPDDMLTRGAYLFVPCQSLVD